MNEIGLSRLITDLCQHLCIKNEQDLKLVPRLKRKSFEIILHWRDFDVTEESDFQIQSEFEKIKLKDRSKLLEDDFLKDEAILKAFLFLLALDKPKEDDQDMVSVLEYFLKSKNQYEYCSGGFGWNHVDVSTWTLHPP